MITRLPLFLLFFSLIAVSCKKDNVKTTWVPDNLRKMIPYTDGQQLKFTDGTSIFHYPVTVSSRIDEYSNCAGCELSSKEENITVTLKDGTYTFITINVNNYPAVGLSIMSSIVNYQTGWGFDFLMEEGGSYSCNGPKQTCLSSITLNGKVYTDVLEITSGATGNNEITKAYYSRDKGLIGYKYGYGIIYTVIE